MEESYIFSPELEVTESTSSPIQSTSELPSIPSTPTLLSTSSSSGPFSNLSQAELIEEAIKNNDLIELQRLSNETGGFQSSELRRRAWPIILGCKSLKANGKEPEVLITADQIEEKEKELNSNVNKLDQIHRDEGQVRLDVIRSFVHYPNDISTEKKEILRERLEKVIVSVLREHPSLRYFQGYHDIISVLLLTLEDDDLTLEVAKQMSLHRIRDSMGIGLEPVLGYLRLVHKILAKADPEMSEMVNLAASLPYFSLSWVLTLMSHDLTSLDVAARLFDFLLANTPAMVSYLGVAIILLKKEALEMLDEEDSQDPAILHHTLSKLPDIQLSKPRSIPSLSPSTAALEKEEDEDLMSNNDDDSYSLSTSHLSESIISLSGTEDEEGDSMDSYSIFSDEMLSDPDIEGTAFSEFLPLTNNFTPPPSSPTSLIGSHSESITNKLPIVYLDDLISKTLELWNQFPLNEIGADQVLGPKSCIFTWEKSLNGDLTDEEADEIAKKGVDIVIEEKLEEEEEELEELESEEEEEKDLIKNSKLINRNEKKKNIKSTRRNTEIGLGAILVTAGILGVVIAIYGNEVIKDSWKFKNFGSRVNWSLVGF